MQTSAKRRRGLGLLGQAGTLSPQQYCAAACGNKQFMAFLQQALQSRQLPSPVPPNANCSQLSPGTGSTKAASLISAGGAAGASIGGALATAGTITGTLAVAIPVVGVAIAAVAGIFSGIFAHHAQAVAMQSNVLCTNVPQANAALQQVQQLVAQGQMPVSEAASALDTLSSEFTSAMKSDPSYKTGDALYGYDIAMQAVCAQIKADLQASQAAVAPGSSSSGSALPGITSGGTAPALASSIFSSTIAGLPVWLLLGGGLLAFMLFEE